MNKRFLVACLVILVPITSCSQKDFENLPSDYRSGGEIMADPTFAWSTTRKISIEIKGLQLAVH